MPASARRPLTVSRADGAGRYNGIRKSRRPIRALVFKPRGSGAGRARARDRKATPVCACGEYITGCVNRLPRPTPSPVKRWNPTRFPRHTANARMAESRLKKSMSMVVSIPSRQRRRNTPAPLRIIRQGEETSIERTLSGGVRAAKTARFGSKVRNHSSTPGTRSVSAAIAGWASTVLPISESLMIRIFRGGGSFVRPKTRAGRRRRLGSQHSGTPTCRPASRMASTWIMFAPSRAPACRECNGNMPTIPNSPPRPPAGGRTAAIRVFGSTMLLMEDPTACLYSVPRPRNT